MIQVIIFLLIFFGCVVIVMVIFFDVSGVVDFSVVVNLVWYFVDQGFDGLLLCGIIGELLIFSWDE